MNYQEIENKKVLNQLKKEQEEVLKNADFPTQLKDFKILDNINTQILKHSTDKIESKFLLGRKQGIKLCIEYIENIIKKRININLDKNGAIRKSES